MQPINFNSGFNGFHTTSTAPQPGGQTAPVASGAVAAPITPFALGVPVYPMAMMPSYMMAHGGGYPQAQQSAPGGGHVTANPTNSTVSQQQQGANGGFGFGAGYAGFGMPVLMSPVLMAIGFPVYYGAPPPNQGGPAPQPAPDPAPAPTPAPDVPDVPTAPAPSEPDVIDVVPEPADDLPVLPITEVSADDFARYRYAESSKKAETSLSLALKTQDGDVISLDFSQMDVMEMSRFRGKTLEGQRVRESSYMEDTERLVNMQVQGSLDADEQAAIDEVLSTVIQVVNKFFSGDMQGAISKLKAMDFDTGELAELSLDMSMSRTAEVTRGYHNGDNRVHDALTKDADVMQALEFLASEQKRMIDMANTAFDTPSSVKLIKSLMPPLMSEPFADLKSKIAEAEEVPLVDDLADQNPELLPEDDD